MVFTIMLFQPVAALSILFSLHNCEMLFEFHSLKLPFLPSLAECIPSSPQKNPKPCQIKHIKKNGSLVS